MMIIIIIIIINNLPLLELITVNNSNLLLIKTFTGNRIIYRDNTYLPLIKTIYRY